MKKIMSMILIVILMLPIVALAHGEDHDNEPDQLPSEEYEKTIPERRKDHMDEYMNQEGERRMSVHRKNGWFGASIPIGSLIVILLIVFGLYFIIQR
ncbi:hypothetical protein Halha_1021 [Halobacteroides halobius DSM 5150]|uniref:Uncharacterized protein n=1 Tax=Halobacteroides halobius (strain ATCC 35273 / DSM 5150 / MD-1) TaxID=748449 RepID=L0K6T6_HALHC|nr:hypothetical protein [Halobacteroides halobius]AGB40982.1 hypothetical protein Halha_1021 [Halobacteroides halobius DSM 5150]